MTATVGLSQATISRATQKACKDMVNPLQIDATDCRHMLHASTRCPALEPALLPA